MLLAQSEQGTESPGAMTLVASELVKALRPDYVVMVGIAYGLRQDQQELGDVLVSTQVRVADLVKVAIIGGEVRELRRGDHVMPSPLLLDRCRSATIGWDGATVHFGPLLAKNTLVNDRATRERIKAGDPDAVGGEMEGAGLYSAAARDQVRWIIVKGISDWGSDKDAGKRKRAAATAAAFVMHVLRCGGLAG